MSNIEYISENNSLGKVWEAAIVKASKIFILVDSNTLEHVWPKFVTMKGLEKAEVIEVPPGEESKSVEVAYNLWQTLLDYGADRSSLLINIGGGVVTDLGGFVASTFKRGIPFINVPTSLLAMVDASVGGKTGVNLGHSKNQVGTFSNANQVIIYPELLITLPSEHLRSGFGEMLKHGLIVDNDYWMDLKNIKEITVENVSPLIAKSIAIKSKVVDEDPKEKGLRKILNFGHTFGHAIESVLLDRDHPILHGDAVALGMVLETEVSFNKKLISMNEKMEIQEAIEKLFLLNPILNIEYKDLWREMKNDKKNVIGQVNLTLLRKIGQAKYDCICTEEELKIAFDEVLNQIRNN